MRPELTAERLRELLHYDPETGVFTWKTKAADKVRVGAVAGYLSGKGRYFQICVNKRQYYAHRLAWLYVTGAWPQHGIDHINGDRCDNRFANLRDVPARINNENRRSSKAVSGLMGVSRNTTSKRESWVATITVCGVVMHIGCFPTPEAAHQAYLEAKRKHHEGCTI